MTNSSAILAAVTQVIDARRRELDSDGGLTQVKIVVRKLAGDRWFVQLGRETEIELVGGKREVSDGIAGVVRAGRG